ncbi:dihydrodipicolinate synthase family protein [Burkholderia sp. 22PA0106]|uniref:dihydrodipicolinate synthase family protein n=1 Tax=Burkholderia sp. 22PA0106 TaxID=3237371 RepID=UPI0039C2654F
MQTTSGRLKGVLAPVLTPFDAHKTPDPVRFVRLSKWLVGQGCGLAMFGTNSEGNSLSTEEKIDLLQHVVDAGIPPASMLPGTGSCSLTDAVKLTQKALEFNCAGVLALPPFYYKAVTDDGLFAFYSELIERVGDDRLRIYLYHIPPVAQVGFSHALVERLLKRYPVVIAGMKDTGGDWAYTSKTIELFSNDGFDVFAGSESILLKTMRAGGAGCISALANVNPAQIVQLFNGWEEAQAESQQKHLNLIREKFSSYPLIAAMKSAIAQATDDPQWAQLRPPLLPLDLSQQKTLHESLNSISFEIRNLNS